MCHVFIRLRDARCLLGVYLDVGVLSLEVDPIVGGVLLGDGENARVWTMKAWD